jgi:hypothetical protein
VDIAAQVAIQVAAVIQVLADIQVLVVMAKVDIQA